MSKKKKLIAKIMENPIRSDITLDEIDLFLRYQGFVKNRNTGGSHILYTRKDLQRPITIHSIKGKIPRYVVKQIQKIIMLDL